jgi:hypothetical protein
MRVDREETSPKRYWPKLFPHLQHIIVTRKCRVEAWITVAFLYGPSPGTCSRSSSSVMILPSACFRRPRSCWPPQTSRS